MEIVIPNGSINVASMAHGLNLGIPIPLGSITSNSYPFGSLMPAEIVVLSCGSEVVKEGSLYSVPQK